jgi:hypothetical protein
MLVAGCGDCVYCCARRCHACTSYPEAILAERLSEHGLCAVKPEPTKLTQINCARLKLHQRHWMIHVPP